MSTGIKHHPCTEWRAAEQYFWFRHSFMLGREESSTLQGAVQQLLRDSKLEVRPQSQLPRPGADAPCRCRILASYLR